MSSPSDQQLIQFIGQGRREALASLFDRYGADLYDYLARLVGDRDQAARQLEEVFLRVPGAVAGLPPRESVRGWLYSLSREAGLGWLRQRGWLDSLPPSDEAIQPGLAGDVWRAGRAMPAFYRAVLITEELHALSPTEKARALGVNRTDLPRLVDEARRAFNRNFDAQARAEGRPTSAQIDPERVWGLRRRLPVEGGSLFGFLPPLVMPESLQQTLRRRIVEAVSPPPARPPAQEQVVETPIPIVIPPVGPPPGGGLGVAAASEPQPLPPAQEYTPAPVAVVAPPPQRFTGLQTSAVAALIGIALALAICGAIFMLTQDRTAPVITGLQPPNGAIVQWTPVINVVALYRDDREIDRTRSSITVDGHSIPPVWIDNSIAYSGPIDIGSHTATVELVDRAGNRSEQTWTFFVVPPGSGTPTSTPLPTTTALPVVPTVTPVPIIITTTPLPPPTQGPIIITATSGPIVITATSVPPTAIPPTQPPPTGIPCNRGSVTGVAFNDLNGNGVREPNEPGLAGVVVNLLTVQNQTLAVTVTDAFGNYRFGDLPFNQYRVQASTPPGWFPTTATLYTVNLFGCGTYSGLDFGFAQAAPPTITPSSTPIVITATPISTLTPSYTPIIITATFVPTVTSTPTPPPLVVVAAVAAVTPPPPSVCPQTFTFDGQITVTGTGNVKYKWEQSDGGGSSDLVITFLAPGTQSVPPWPWTLGEPGFNYTGWAQLHVLLPNDVTSNQATFNLVCPPATLTFTPTFTPTDTPTSTPTYTPTPP